MRLRLGMLASHGGTNVQSVVNACRDGRLPAESALIISNNRDSAVLKFARARGVPSVWIGGAEYEDQTLRDEAICTQLSNHDVDVVLLLGYMRKLGPATLERFQNRILNIHPALLPKHGGKGKYGIHVHESVQCRVSVLDTDSLAALQARVLAREHEFLVETLTMIAIGSIHLI